MSIFKGILGAAVGLCMMGMAPAAHADVFDIDAKAALGTWKEVVTTVTAGTLYTFDTLYKGLNDDGPTFWTACATCSPQENWESDAGGIASGPYAGGYTFNGQSFNYGAVVIQMVGGSFSGAFKLVGMGPVAFTDAELGGAGTKITAGYWDSYWGDNEGVQTLSVTTSAIEPGGNVAPAPGPVAGAGLPMLLGVAGLIVWRRRSAAKAV